MTLLALAKHRQYNNIQPVPCDLGELERFLCQDISGRNVHLIHVNTLDTLLVKTLLSELFVDITQPNIPKYVIVYNTITLQRKKQNMYTELVGVDFFDHDYLLLLLNGHRFLPKFRLLTPEEREETLKCFPFESLPCMVDKDPMSLLNDYKVGDLVLIERPREVPYIRKIVRDDS